MIKNNYILIISVVIFLFFGCDNEPYEGEILIEDNSCLFATQNTLDAAEDLASATDENYSLLCQVYRDVVQDQIEACGDEDGSLQLILNTLGDCEENVGVDLCAEAIAATEIAQSNYESATDENLEDRCNMYKNALLNQISICGDGSGELQAILDQLGDCTVDLIPIEGDWLLTFIVTENPLDIDNDEQDTINIYPEMDCHQNESIVFFDDGTGAFTRTSFAAYSYTTNTSSFDGVDYIVDCISADETRTFNWVRDGNNVIATFMDNGEVLPFLKSTNVLSQFTMDGFSADSTDGSPDIVQDIAFVYVKN